MQILCLRLLKLNMYIFLLLQMIFQVLKGINKAKALHRKENTSEDISRTVNSNALMFDEITSQKEALKKFILQRQVSALDKLKN